MTRISSLWATAGAALMALTLPLGLAATVSPAQARPIYVEIPDMPGEVKAEQKTSRSAMPARGTVCCLLPRGKRLLWTQLSSCRKAKGQIRPSGACVGAAKAKDAYFVKVDSETTTQNGKSGSARARAGTVLEEIEVEKEVDRSSAR